MTHDEIIEMARQAGMYQDLNVSFNQSIQNFAKLVAAKEREACAKLVSDIEWKCVIDDVDDTPLKEIVKAIRARGEA